MKIVKIFGLMSFLIFLSNNLFSAAAVPDHVTIDMPSDNVNSPVYFNVLFECKHLNITDSFRFCIDLNDTVERVSDKIFQTMQDKFHFSDDALRGYTLNVYYDCGEFCKWFTFDWGDNFVDVCAEYKLFFLDGTLINPFEADVALLKFIISYE